MIEAKTVSDWLDEFGLEQKRQGPGVQLGLERIQLIASKMNLLPYSLPVVTVAGTNGKGSTVELLQSILIAHGLSVGSFTSPHLFKVNERIKIDGVNIDDASLMKAFQEIDAKILDITPTYFEWLTLAALHIFKERGLDFVLLEVGLGGRLDAVNILDPIVSVITSIGLDHQDYLGDTIEEIAAEKMGVFRKDGKAVCGCFSPPQCILDKATEWKMPLFCQNREFEYVEHGETWDFISTTASFMGLPIPTLSLQNAASAIQTLSLLPISINREALIKGLKNAYLCGRMEYLPGTVNYLFDVAHNIDSIKRLANRLATMEGRVCLLFSMFKDKNLNACISLLAPYIEKWFVSPLDSARTLTVDEFKQVFLFHNIDNVAYYDSVRDAFEQANNELLPGDTLVVTGSFLTVGMAYKSGYTDLICKKGTA
jgi:dihydrofolate synthase/folylpolyglutamate synthase